MMTHLELRLMIMEHDIIISRLSQNAEAKKWQIAFCHCSLAGVRLQARLTAAAIGHIRIM